MFVAHPRADVFCEKDAASPREEDKRRTVTTFEIYFIICLNSHDFDVFGFILQNFFFIFIKHEFLSKTIFCLETKNDQNN